MSNLQPTATSLAFLPSSSSSDTSDTPPALLVPGLVTTTSTLPPTPTHHAPSMSRPSRPSTLPDAAKKRKAPIRTYGGRFARASKAVAEDGDDTTHITTTKTKTKGELQHNSIEPFTEDAASTSVSAATSVGAGEEGVKGEEKENEPKRGRKRVNTKGLGVEEGQPRKRQRSSNCDEENGGEKGAVNGSGTGEGKAGEKTEKRILRSQEKGARNKTILDTYFPWIDEEWAEEAKKNEYIGLDTPMTFLLPPRRLKRSPSPASDPTQISAHNSKPPKIRLSKPPPRTPPPQFPTFDFTPFDALSSTYTSDPLPSTHYFKSHRRMEVSEKRLRNIERERVAHEISKLETRLELLRGNDWLRALGFERTYGMSVEERRRLEGVREDVCAELEGIMGKYKFWREGEKRKRRRDDRRGRRRRGGSTEPPPAEESSVEEEYEEQVEEVPPPTTPLRKPIAIGGGKTPKHVEQIRKMEESPFVSFYKKPHLRAQAMAQSRRSGRNLTAFGVAVPAFPEREFALPEWILGEGEREGRGLRRRGRR